MNATRTRPASSFDSRSIPPTTKKALRIRARSSTRPGAHATTSLAPSMDFEGSSIALARGGGAAPACPREGTKNQLIVEHREFFSFSPILYASDTTWHHVVTYMPVCVLCLPSDGELERLDYSLKSSSTPVLFEDLRRSRWCIKPSNKVDDVCLIRPTTATSTLCSLSF